MWYLGGSWIRLPVLLPLRLQATTLTSELSVCFLQHPGVPDECSLGSKLSKTGVPLYAIQRVIDRCRWKEKLSRASKEEGSCQLCVCLATTSGSTVSLFCMSHPVTGHGSTFPNTSLWPGMISLVQMILLLSGEACCGECVKVLWIGCLQCIRTFLVRGWLTSDNEPFLVWNVGHEVTVNPVS